MPVVTIDGLGAHAGETVTLRGWLYARRSSGKLHFLLVRDGTGTIQCVVFKNDVAAEVFERADHLPQESSLDGHRRRCAPTRARRSATSSRVTDLRGRARRPASIRSRPRSTAPRSCSTTATCGCARRASTRSCASAPRSCAPAATTSTSAASPCFDAPIFTPAACEGTTTLFEIDYFDDKAYLTQSGQLYVEAGALAFGKVYCFGPTFRAEKSKTRRHLTEFWMVEPEVAFADLDGDMDLAEDFLAHVVGRVARATRRRELRSARARPRRRSSACGSRSRASPTTRRSSCLRQQGVAGRVGRRLRRRRGDRALAALRPAGDGAPLSGRSARPST